MHHPAPPYGPQHGYGYAFPHPPPPDPPELPAKASAWPRWPWWYGPAAMGVGLIATLIVVGVMGGLRGGGRDRDPEDANGFLQIATVIQQLIFVGVAVFFASRTERPRAWHFGLRRTRFWRTIGWAALGFLAYWVFAIVYGALLQPDAEQETLESLGTDESTLWLIGAGLLVIVAAPIAEEIFFRGFFYRALRTRLPIVAAALVDGAIFGVIHYENPDTLVILPVLAALGVIFCLVYEKTGSLFPVIGAPRPQQLPRLRRRDRGMGRGGRHRGAHDRRLHAGATAPAGTYSGARLRPNRVQPRQTRVGADGMGQNGSHMRTRSLLLALLDPARRRGRSRASAATGSRDPPPTTTPTPSPAEAKLSVGVASLSDRRKRWVLAGQALVASGRIDPYVAGEKVTLELYRGKKRLGRRTVEVKDKGRFTTTFNAVKKPGSYFVRARHAGTDKQKAANSERANFGAVRSSSGSGSNGQHVRLLQIGLRKLAYVAPLNGRHDGATGRAVMAFRKVNGMSRTFSANTNVMRALFAGRGGYRLRFPKAGKHAEADLSRAVLVLAERGKAVRIYHTSPGKPSTPTVRGSFRVYRRSPGTNSHGMVHSAYFIRGYAVHGYNSVPAYPASHGCLRVPIPNARSIYNWFTMGTRIDVYA